jgi:hypothetical protein
LRATAAALLSLWLVGCAPAATLRSARTRLPPSPPISQWETGTDEEPVAQAPQEPVQTTQAETVTDPAEAVGQDGMAPASSLPFAGIEPEVVHRARIDMARAALVDENQNKERVDLAEELQRELAALQASAQTSKSRVRHGAPTKKQP